MLEKNILITGGCGFVGSNLAIKIKANNSDYKITCFDNLKRRGSELNIPRLREHNIDFIHGDIRIKEDLESLEPFSLIIDAAAEPSALAGFNGSCDYLYNTNLSGTFNILNFAAKHKSKLIFLSTSRVYPVEEILKANIQELETRFIFEDQQEITGITKNGIDENLNLYGHRTLYGTTKISSEFLIKEYENMFGLEAIINRCGVITGPYQMGKIDQGFVVLWMAKHFWKKELRYIGFGGKGKQVRDLLHIDDLYNLIELQIKDFYKAKGKVYNVGGGNKVNSSLLEFTKTCEEIVGNKIVINPIELTRQGDIPIYITNNNFITKELGWTPNKTVSDIANDIFYGLRKMNKF